MEGGAFRVQGGGWGGWWTCCWGALLLRTSSPLFLDAVAPPASAGVAEAIAAGSAGLTEAGRALPLADQEVLAVTRTCQFALQGSGLGSRLKAQSSECGV